MAVTPGQWTHFAATRADGMVTLYLNGESTQTFADAHFMGNPVWIGGQDEDAYPFDGTIDEVRIYDRALTASEIQELAGVGGEGAFAATSFGEDGDLTTVQDDRLVEVDGTYVYINVGASPELNYGIGDFTVVVMTRTSDVSSPVEETILSLRQAQSLRQTQDERYLRSVSHTAVGLRQGQELFLYLDGALQAQKTVGAGKVKRLKVSVGLDEDSTNIVIEDVQRYPYALSSEEISRLGSEKDGAMSYRNGGTVHEDQDFGLMEAVPPLMAAVVTGREVTLSATIREPSGATGSVDFTFEIEEPLDVLDLLVGEMLDRLPAAVLPQTVASRDGQHVIPEPSMMALVGLGVLGIIIGRKLWQRF